MMSRFRKLCGAICSLGSSIRRMVLAALEDFAAFCMIRYLTRCFFPGSGNFGSV